MASSKSYSRRQFTKTGSEILRASLAAEKVMSVEKDLSTSVEVPAYSGRGVSLDAGSTIRVTNTHGTQVGDMFALLRSDPSEYLDTARTRLLTGRIFPKTGQQFCSNRYTPLLSFTADTSPGIHDTMYATCDSQFYEILAGVSEHPNCNDNYLSATRELGLTTQFVPMPVNLFQNTPIAPDGVLSGGPSPARAGDYVEFHAEADIYFFLTACSVDGEIDINGGKSKPLLISVIT